MPVNQGSGRLDWLQRFISHAAGRTGFSLLLHPCGIDPSPRFDVAHGRLAKEAAVLAAELAGAFVAYLEGGAGSVEPGGQHAFQGHRMKKRRRRSGQR